MARRYRNDELGEHRTALDRARRKIYATQTVCGICGKPVDMSLRYPNPMSKTIDHIIPINRGGHPSDIENLQLAHLTCNLAKADRLLSNAPAPSSSSRLSSSKGLTNTSTALTARQSLAISNRNLPLSYDWKNYKTRNA